MPENMYELIFKTIDRDDYYKRTGYKIFTTFYEDFSIADAFGMNGIMDTYLRAKREWKHDYKYITELSLILNMKLSEWYAKGRLDYVSAYSEALADLSDYRKSHFTEKQIRYFYKVFDRVNNN